MNRHCLMFFTCCLLLLAGCATEITQRHLSLNDALLAHSSMQKGQHKHAAGLYQALAKSEPAHQDAFNLLSAEAFFKSGDSLFAEKHITLINTATLSLEQRNRLNLLAAQISLSHGQAETATDQLSIITAYALKLKNKIAFYQSLAFAHSLTGHPLQSAQARIQLTPLLENKEHRQENHQVILNTLKPLSSQTLILQQPPAPDVLGGWMAMAQLLKTRKSSHDLAEFQANLSAWKQLFPQHPATDFLHTFSPENIPHNFKQASAIALFLPESGRYAEAAQIIKEGFTTAYQQSLYQPALRFYDSSAGSILHLYHQAIAEGAELIIGPLSKDKIDSLAVGTELTTPILALNHIPDLIKKNLLQFGLSPIDEARQVAIKARNDGHDKILLLTSESRQGQRMAQHFTEFWEAKGGTILETQVYNPKANDFSQPIKDLLNLEESKYRYRQLQQLLGSPLQFTERRRHDADALFLSTNPHTARSIYPQLRFYRATRLPVYAPPQIYSGQANPSQDLDLNSITFCDIPWLFSDAYQDELSLAALKDRGQSFSPKHPRLFALGIDSFNIIAHLGQLDNMPYAGATGSLSLNLENRITRQLVCAKFIDGIPVLQNFINTESAVDDQRIYAENVF